MSTKSGHDKKAIGDEGELLFCKLMRAWRWRQTKVETDWGADFYVETASSPGSEGHTFVVQVKTESRTNKKSRDRVVRLKHGPARHLQQHKLAAFVVHVALDTEELRWMYVTEALDRNSGLRDRADVQLRIGETHAFARNVAAPSVELISDIERGAKYVAARVHGSLLLHAQQRSAFLSSLDPQYKARVEVVDGRERVGIDRVDPNSASRFSVRLMGGKDLRHKIDEMMGWGTPLEASRAVLKLPDSKLFETLIPDQAEGSIRFDPKPQWAGVARVGPTITFEEGQVVAGQLVLNMTVTSGLKGERTHLTDSWGAVSLELRSGNDPRGAAELSLGITEQLINTPIGGLYRLRGTSRLLAALRKGEEIGIEPIGNRPQQRMRLRLDSEQFDADFGEIVATVEALESLSYLPASPVVSNLRVELEHCSWEGMGRWVVASQLLRGQDVAMDVDTFRLEHSFAVDDARIATLTSARPVIQHDYFFQLNGRVSAWIPVDIMFDGFDVESVQPNAMPFAVMLRPRGEDSRLTIRAIGPPRFRDLGDTPNASSAQPSNHPDL